MRRARVALAVLVRSLRGPRAARVGRFALVTGAHLLVLYLLLRIPEIREPVEARVQSTEITFFHEPRRPAEGNLGTREPKLARLRVEVSTLPEVRIPDVPVAAALHTPSMPSASLVFAAPSVPKSGRGGGGGAGTGAGGGSGHGILVVSRVLPPYPPVARLLGEYGTVIIGAEVDPRGRLIQVKVLRSSGFRELDQAAAEAVGRYKFRVAAKGGQSNGVWLSVEMNFNITCGSAPRPGESKDARNASCLYRSRAAGAWRFQP
ncbi:MAG: energy transducer TonB [Steroidobacteraceae bacterium]